MSGTGRRNMRLVPAAAQGLSAPETVTPTVRSGGPGRLLLDALPALTVIVDHRGDSRSAPR